MYHSQQESIKHSLVNKTQQQQEQEDQNQILKYDHSLSAQFTKTGERPQNSIKNADPSIRYNKNPRLHQLIEEKTTFIKKRNHPPVYLNRDLKTFDLSTLSRNSKFDAILCDPPWEEYEKRARRLGIFAGREKQFQSWTTKELCELNVKQLGQAPSFLFLWVGSEHLEDGREVMKSWGYRRCEDIVWIKTNIYRKSVTSQSNNDLSAHQSSNGSTPESIFIRVKEHCLMGYKGEPKKVSDHNLIHPNIDIDVIVTEEPQSGLLQKPEEIYDIIERFCLGRKRLELFGRNNNIRNGWLTIGNEVMISEDQKDTSGIEGQSGAFRRQAEYEGWFAESQGGVNGPNVTGGSVTPALTGSGKFSSTPQQHIGFKGGRLLGTNATIESLRPKEDPATTPMNSQTKISEDGGGGSGKKSVQGKDQR